MQLNLLTVKTAAPVPWPGRATSQPTLADMTTPPRPTLLLAEFTDEEPREWTADFFADDGPCEPYTGDC